MACHKANISVLSGACLLWQAKAAVMVLYVGPSTAALASYDVAKLGGNYGAIGDLIWYGFKLYDPDALSELCATICPTVQDSQDMHRPSFQSNTPKPCPFY